MYKKKKKNYVQEVFHNLLEIIVINGMELRP